jgi:pimeloyl-ACP methyl ester carboxylesterase
MVMISVPIAGCTIVIGPKRAPPSAALATPSTTTAIMTPEAAVAALRKTGAQWQCLVEPGAGHWLQFEQADAVNRHLVDWFRPVTT